MRPVETMPLRSQRLARMTRVSRSRLRRATAGSQAGPGGDLECVEAEVR